MVTLQRNKQKMKYSLQGTGEPIYQMDENGNIKTFTDSEGNKIAMKTGEYDNNFHEPVDFKACINNKLSEDVWREYGIDDSTNYSQIVTAKGYLPVKTGDVIWRTSDVVLDENGNVDSESSDYIVKGVADEGLNYDVFLLQKNVKNGGE